MTAKTRRAMAQLGSEKKSMWLRDRPRRWVDRRAGSAFPASPAAGGWSGGELPPREEDVGQLGDRRIDRRDEAAHFRKRALIGRIRECDLDDGSLLSDRDRGHCLSYRRR